MLLSIPSITALQRSRCPPAPSLLLPRSPAPVGGRSRACVPPKHSRTPQAANIHREDIQGKRLFQRQGGGSCSGIAGSCRIKEASKIAALNYIPANERHANNGHCATSPGMGVSPLAARMGSPGWHCHRGDPTEAAAAALAGSGDDGDIGELLLTGKSSYSCSQGRVRRWGRRDARMPMKSLSSSHRSGLYK